MPPASQRCAPSPVDHLHALLILLAPSPPPFRGSCSTQASSCTSPCRCYSIFFAFSSVCRCVRCCVQEVYTQTSGIAVGVGCCVHLADIYCRRVVYQRLASALPGCILWVRGYVDDISACVRPPTSLVTALVGLLNSAVPGLRLTRFEFHHNLRPEHPLDHPGCSCCVCVRGGRGGGSCRTSALRNTAAAVLLLLPDFGVHSGKHTLGVVLSPRRVVQRVVEHATKLGLGHVAVRVQHLETAGL